MTTHKVYVDTESLSKEELEQLLIDKDKENKRLVKNLAEYKNEITDLKEENKNLKEEIDIATKCSSKEENGIIRFSEENNKLKLHIEAKDKAYIALLKDYEELKEDRDKMKKRVKEHIIYSIKAEFIKKFGE